ncbi:MAG: aspartate-semialdehyde dehydrogenase [Candidatus Kapabacteria bacterium]|nr:aspartate-semialdehyde dehydrogenase [Candidatus Kapabacteria bacterium]
MNVAIIGATGLVGRTMLRVLEERHTPVNRLVVAASKRSAGETFLFRGQPLTVVELTPEVFDGIDVALFSAGGSVSREFAPIAAARGCVVIDNSSAWRMDPSVPLVVPEVNPDDALKHRGIIANPNCSTIQLVVALKPLAEAFGLKRVVVSTYQTPSGAGQKGIDQLEAELAGTEPATRITPHRLAGNTVFHTIDELSGGSEEEIKIVRETRRILHSDALPLAVTCVRVPVVGGHGEAVAVETLRACPPDEVRTLLSASPGIVVMDDPANDVYPMPSTSNDTDAVYVGRIRPDSSVDHGVLLWIVADNLRKGAATNAVQILEVLQAHQ